MVEPIYAAMPGRILSVLVAQNETVKAGQPVVIMESMKMEFTISSPRDGIIESIFVEPETTVDVGQPVLTLK